MIDVSPKFKTLRYAKAQGVFFAQPEIIQRIAESSVPKGDVRQVARAAGIIAAKRTADTIVFCHPIPLDVVEVSFELNESSMTVTAEVKSVWKTGVEMEALTAVTAALMNTYDMLKPLSDDLSFGDIRLLKKRGGKSHFKDEFEHPLKAAVLVISDSTFTGDREDKSGKIIQKFLEEQPVDVAFYEVLPDDETVISGRLKSLADSGEYHLIFTTGGTGLGPKDLTPEATRSVIQKEIPGIAEAIRSHGKDRTPYAMLSRELVGLRGGSLIVNLPGSSKGAEESMHALFPGILHAFHMMWGGGHDKKGT